MFFLIILKLTVSASFWSIWPHLYCSHALPFSIGRNTCILYLHIFTFIYTCLWLTGPNAGPGAELCFWDIPGMFEWQRSLGQHQGKILSTILTSKISSDMLVSMWVSVWVSMYYHAPNNLVSLYCLCLIWISVELSFVIWVVNQDGNEPLLNSDHLSVYSPYSLFCQAFVLKEGSQVPLITGVISMPCTDVEPVSHVSTKNKDLFEWAVNLYINTTAWYNYIWTQCMLASPVTYDRLWSAVW